MILQCKNCNARYLVPDQAIGTAGRTVRCARCNHNWFENPFTPPTDSPEKIPDFDVMLDSINSSPAPSSPTTNLPAAIPNNYIAFKAIAAVFLISIAGLFLFIVKPSLFGITHSKGLILADIKIDKTSDEQSSKMEISGNIVNITDTPSKVSNLRIMLLDSTDYPLQSWEFGSNGETINPKENMPFSSGELNIKSSLAKRMVIDLGTPIELKLRQKPQ